ERIRLFASRCIDQQALDIIDHVWSTKKDGLLRGETFYVADRASERRLPPPPSKCTVASFAVMPVFDGETLLALLFVDSTDPHFCDGHDLDRLQKFSRIIAKAVGDSSAGSSQGSVADWQTYLERTPVEDLEREKLLLLLNRNEWNIARVSRLMGVTRRTIYLRLQRYNILRERIYKTRNRRAARLDHAQAAANS
ncbi:MAG: GAF domain-containing protein, partial [Vicinamibacteria bacterium]|nr:GAF domain-containing protein [Vicinamibacteria bacterium]